jgi:putative solute:sodium symporter small subunit
MNQENSANTDPAVTGSAGMSPREYWRKNIACVLGLLAVWFVVSYGCGILFVEELNRITFGGFQLGFWMAQQGSIYVFVVLIFVYVRLMNRLDREYAGGKGDDTETSSGEEEGI